MSRQQLLILQAEHSQASHPDQYQSLAAFQITDVRSLAGAYSAVQEGAIDCVLVKGEIEEFDPVEILETIHHANPGLPVVFCRENMSAGLAVRLVRTGAHDCFDTCEITDDLCDALKAAAARKRSIERVLRERKDAREPWRDILVGESGAMEAVAETIRLVGNRRCTVLISGETGTGKELAARALHAASPRGHHQMVALNCSALPENLLEAELFGHTRGAFTGAASARIGRFEQAKDRKSTRLN